MSDEVNGSVNRVWLRGFLRGVDCRPVHFRDALGTTVVCNLCGLVARRMASLPCSHVFCDFCFWDCTSDDPCAQVRCIFDRSTLDVENVRWNETRPLDLVNAKVRCWNARYGCDFTGPLRGLLDHFEHDCTFQAAICPRCQNIQLRSKLADHYRSGCVAPSTATSRGSHQPLIGSVSGGRRVGASLAPMQDTLAAFESKMNELLEHMRALDTRTSLLHADMKKAKEELVRLLPEGATGAVVPGVTAGVDVSPVRERREMASGLEDTSTARLLPRFFLRRGETCTLRVAFEKSRARHSTEADLSSPLDQEVWTTRCETPDRTCNLSLVLLEEGTALSVYAAADQCVDVFNPWTLRSVAFTSPRRLFPPGRLKLLTPTWLVSRQSRASLLDQGFERFRSRPLEEILRSCFFFGRDDEVVVLTVKLVRKFRTL